ncbi:hypothetical protein DPMN_164043 [Dreissena polymorpha]|uniref:Neurotransmitter-gated ion-channel ligand-binding domain-containing protein n=1 Tax=Dreissena polymorpha TaxID=45954 RepID=A0A9D4IV73_DREPO|nr:hypothetical protein DPMN_164043 [Dreissena polymorpha]
MSRVLVRLLMFQWICTTCFVTSETANDTKNLIMKLFQPAGYTKTIRPLINQHHVLTVRTDMFLNSIIDFNEQEENIKISGHLFIRWFDEFLQWNPEEYGGLESFVSPQDDIWRPDVALHNSFRTFTGLGSSNYC